MAVVFDCSSSMAMFRKPYTTTSSVSFAFPPPSAVAGLIAAIVGLGNGAATHAARADYWNELAGTRVAVSILKETDWLRAAINFWNVKNPQDNAHIQVKHQFIAAPSYRLYVKGGVEERLKSMLEKDSFVYTPYLGVAYAIADITYHGECQETQVESGDVKVRSVLPWRDDIALNLSECKGIFSETVPFRLDEERRFLKSVKVVYSADSGSPLCLREKGGSDVARIVASGVEDTIAWFPEW